MARKLVVMMALISLVLLTQVNQGLADTYNLSTLGDAYVFTWTESRVNYPPGSYNSATGETTTFRAVSDTSPTQGEDWKIPNLLCDPTLTTYTSVGDEWVSVKITYTTPSPNMYDPEGTPLFAAYKYYDGSGNLITDKPIVSSDAVIITTAIYKKDPVTGLPSLGGPESSGNYNIQDQIMYLTGSGHDSDGTFFTLSATLNEVSTNHTHYGYFENFSITYPAAAQTPIPGAVWLLGTGLLGLGCVGWRRRS